MQYTFVDPAAGLCWRRRGSRAGGGRFVHGGGRSGDQRGALPGLYQLFIIAASSDIAQLRSNGSILKSVCS